MAIQVLIDDRYRHRGTEFVSINPKLSRLSVYKKGVEVFTTNYGKDMEFVQILTDPDRPSLFWIKPCDGEAPGSRKFDRTSKHTRTLSIRSLLKQLDWQPQGTVRLGLEWDKEVGAARIDTSKAKEKVIADQAE